MQKSKYPRQFRTTLAPSWQKRMFALIEDKKTDIAKFQRTALKEYIEKEEAKKKLKRGDIFG